MKKSFLAFIIGAFLCSLSSLANAASVIMTGLQGNASTYLQQGTTNYVVFGFSLYVPANQTFNPGTLSLSVSQNLNGFYSQIRLMQVASADPTLATTGTSVGANISANNPVQINSFPSVSGGTNGVTNYYYLVFDMATTTNTPPASFTFSIPSSQSGYAGALTVNNLSSSTSYTILTNIYWKGGTSGAISDWATAGNWAKDTQGNGIGRVPNTGDNVIIGKISYTNQPVIGSAVSIGSLVFNTTNPISQAMTLTVGASTSVLSDITVTGDLGDDCAIAISGSGSNTMTVSGNLNIGDATTPSTTHNKISLSLSVPTVIISGNIYLKANQFNSQKFFNPGLSIKSGTVTASSLIATQSASGLTDTLSVKSGATLNFTGATALGSLGSTGTNYINFLTGSTIGYTGTDQTVYTTYLSTGTSYSAITYSNLNLSGSGTKTVSSGALTVGAALNTSATSTLFNTNNPTVTVTGTWTNTGGVTLGTGAATATTLAINGGTFNAGSSASSALTVSSTASSSFSIVSGATFSAGIGTITYKGGYTNAGTFTYGAGTVIFDNSGAAQSIVDNSTAGTSLYNVTFQGGLTSTLSGSGNFNVASTGKLTMAANTTLNAGGVLTLRSDASGSTYLSQIPSTAKISGNVNVQRYLTGNSSAYRGYRILSSPVNLSTSGSTSSNYSLQYINTSQTLGGTTYRGAITGGPSSNFSVNMTNPTLYLWKEGATANANANNFTSGYYYGITNIGASGVSTLYQGTSGSATIPAGNGYIMYFIGDTHDLTNLKATVRTPENTTITASGYLNQGNIIANIWNNQNGKLQYTALSTYAGYNMIGNPYASTIDLTQVYNDNLLNISNKFYELVDNTQSYVVWDAFVPASSTGSRYVASGQGFFTIALAPTSTLTFKETQKVSTIVSNSSNPPSYLSAPDRPQLLATSNKSIAIAPSSAMAINPSATNDQSGFHFRFTQDADNYDDISVFFSKKWSDKFDQNDAVDLDGPAPKAFLSSYTSDGTRTCINLLSDYTKGKKVKLYVKGSVTGIYKIDMTSSYNVDSTLYDIYLKDNFKKDSLDIGRYKTYSFNINTADTASYGANRFELVVRRKPLGQYQLVSFTAKKVSDGVQLTWKTNNEGNYTGFGIDKQNSGQYTSLYTVQSDGNGTYTYTDRSPATGDNIYRLMQNNIDNVVSYSGNVTITYGILQANALSVYPNPVRQNMNITLSVSDNTPASSTSYKFNIYSSSGILISQKASNTTSLSADVANFTPGSYLIEVVDSNGKAVGKSKFIKVQ